MTTRRWRVLTAATYAAIGLIAFARILPAQFVSDDWEFLLVVSQAGNALVIFEPLVGRFVRPLVVFLYYSHFKLFGVHALPFHLTLCLVHAANALLVCELALRIDPDRRRWMGFLAGLLFLLFAGHTEAVSWVAGAADPLVAFFVLGSLLSFAHGLESAAPARAFVAAGALFVLAMLAKEAGAILPALAACSALLHASRHGGWQRTLARTAAFAWFPVAFVLAYLWMRAIVFGTAFGAYTELQSPQDVPLWLLRAFLLRTFLPPLHSVGTLWYYHRDLPLFAAAGGILAAALLTAILRRQDWRGLLFSCAGVAIALSPVVRLSISIVTTESERYVYLPSVFSSLLMAQAAAALLRPRAAVLALSVLIAGHAAYLDRANRNWQDAGKLSGQILDSLIGVTRRIDPATTPVVFLLNIPDQVRGAYVFRRGFYAAVHVLAPDLDARPIRVVSSQTSTSLHDRHDARQSGPREFTLDIHGGGLAQVTPPVHPYYDFPDWQGQRFTIRFREGVPPSALVAVDGGRVVDVGRVSGPGLPVGAIETPAGEAACTGESLQLSGWAIDEREVASVSIQREQTGASPEFVALATATWSSGTRDDLAGLFHGFPRLDRAAWEYALPCALVRAAPGGRLLLRVVAADHEHHIAELGARTIVAR